MRIIVVLFICILFSNCNGKSDKLNTFNDLKNTVWIDSLCNEFHFKDSIISKRLLYQENFFLDPIGKLKSDSLIKLEFNNGNDDIEKYFLESKQNGKLVFKPLDEYNDNLTLINADSIKTTDLKLQKLHLKVTPNFYYSGFREITITNDKKITYRKERNEEKLETAIFSDSTFHQLETYLKILKFDEYKDKYEFYISDGADYEFNIITNKYSKTIESTMLPPEGLWNLISFIDFKLQTEQNTTANNVYN
ncbi:hypothetical protein [uncultured Algibacter sp.]|uniref:hypothetical protein n=1 Tax=uncultured Algibacter sp. TaxID=298659 RepID=UPI0026079D25|nr:hypothetical protein [uncultured Algibacter sp.]